MHYRMVTPGPAPFMAVRGIRLTLNGQALPPGTVLRFCANPGVIANWIPAGLKGGGILDVVTEAHTTPDGITLNAGDNILRNVILYGMRTRMVADPNNPGQTMRVPEEGTEGGPREGETCYVLVGNIMTSTGIIFHGDSFDTILPSDLHSAPAGDANLDGTVDISDLQAVVDLVARGDESARVWQETLINTGTAGSIDISDLQRLIDHVYFGFPMTVREER